MCVWGFCVYVWPGMMPYCLSVMRPNATLSDSLRGMLFLGTCYVYLGGFVPMLLVYSLLLCFFVLVFGRRDMSEGQITRDLAKTRNKLPLAH